jgi:hypothetical protein
MKLYKNKLLSGEHIYKHRLGGVAHTLPLVKGDNSKISAMQV